LGFYYLGLKKLKGAKIKFKELEEVGRERRKSEKTEFEGTLRGKKRLERQKRTKVSQKSLRGGGRN